MQRHAVEVGVAFTGFLQLLLYGVRCEPLMDACAAVRTLVATSMFGPVVAIFGGRFGALVHQSLLVLFGVCGL